MKPALLFLTLLIPGVVQAAPPPVVRIFDIQSIDTMKDSRDLARSALNDYTFDAHIEREMVLIAGTGANYVAIDTPYDEEFIPVLKRWIESARAHGLHIWFRGNFSGWEGWFGYDRISRDQHIAMTRDFILRHNDLFTAGDIFTACPECENGGPGDPRSTGDLGGFQRFLISEHEAMKQAFQSIDVDVKYGYTSMNADVAKLVMDRDTTTKLGGYVVIDDYVRSPSELEDDIIDIHNSSGGQIILGEFGAPVPDLNGDMTDSEQANLIGDLIEVMSRHSDIVVGLNYWNLRQGSTAVITDDWQEKPALNAIKKYYSFRPSLFYRFRRFFHLF